MAAPTAEAAGDPLRAHQWGLDMIEADAAHSVTRGEGAVVAVLDTGVDAAHEDLKGRLLPGHDFVDKDATPQDGNGHGTHVTGIVAANADNGVGVDSVAPGAKVLPIRVLDNSGAGTDPDVAAGIDYAIAHHADVINLSLGGLPLSAIGLGSEFDAAVQRAVSAGIVVVAAAGNDSLPICEQPPVNGKLLCVGAVDRRGLRSFFSSGDGSSIMAPGGSSLPAADEDVLSTVPESKYDYIAGTSQATPHVSGVAALLVSRGVRGQAAVERILATATDAGLPGADALYGHGIVNARAAVEGLPSPRGAGSTGSGGSGGSGSGGSGSTGGAEPKVVLSRVQHIRAVLKRGIRARCRATAAGRCVVTVKRDKTIATGARTVEPGAAATIVVRPTKAGRSLLMRGRGFSATAVVSVPGGGQRTMKLTFRR